MFGRLKWTCKNGVNPIPCGEGSEYCINSQNWCDGIVNCPEGEDEKFANCSDKFPDLASVKCNKSDIFNFDVEIRETPCNHISQCRGGIDELNCSLSDNYLIYFLAAILCINSIMALFWWKNTIRGLEEIPKNQTIDHVDFETFHGMGHLATRMHQIQSLSNAREQNKTFVLMELNHHNQSLAETTLCIKVRVLKILI